MAGAILTPTAIWKNFSVGENAEVKQISKEQVSGDYFVSRFYLSGMKVKDGTVKIYCSMTRPVGQQKTPAVIILQDYKDGTDETLIGELAKKGYTALVVDVCGKVEGREYYTLYPDSLSFANFNYEAVNKNYVDGEIYDTCWYVWANCLRHVVKYLRGFEDVTKIGAMGIGELSTAMWDALAFNEDLSCAVMVHNIGWKGYRGVNKFGGVESDSILDDDRIEYIAGIDPQSYIPHVNFPVLLLSATNCNRFDMDRAFDTAIRIHEGQYCAVNFSVGARDCVDYESFSDALIFFNNYLSEKGKTVFPSEIDISCDIENKKMSVKVSPDVKGLKTVAVYASEENVEPQFRSWRKIPDMRSKDDAGFVFDYKPYQLSKRVFFFAKARYENGFTICSKVICKEFSPEEIEEITKFKVVYSSRLPDADTSFFIADEGKSAPHGLEITPREHVVLVKGPFDMYGISSKYGISTFKIHAEKYKPNEDSILMFDVFGKTDGTVKVKLVADYFGNRTEFVATVKTLSTEFWQNVKLERPSFKTAEGMSLKNYSIIHTIEFVSDGEFAINNVLWV